MTEHERESVFENEDICSLVKNSCSVDISKFITLVHTLYNMQYYVYVVIHTHARHYVQTTYSCNDMHARCQQSGCSWILFRLPKLIYFYHCFTLLGIFSFLYISFFPVRCQSIKDEGFKCKAYRKRTVKIQCLLF